jgi:DNA-binding NarL/FixJ family response regulator
MVEDIAVLVVDEGVGRATQIVNGLPGDGARLVGTVADAPSALRALAGGSFRLLLVNLDRDDRDAIEVVRRICERDGHARVLGLTREEGSDMPAAALAAGACGVMSPEANGETVVASFRRALAGELVLPAAHLPDLVDRLRDGREATVAGRLRFLTRREREILRALADGSATADIAQTLGIRPMTVQSHVKNILAKLGVHSKVEAVTMAWRMGLGSATRSA